MADLMKVGPKGQVVIPHKFRQELNIRPGSRVYFVEEGGSLRINRAEKTEEIFAEIAHKTGKTGELNPHEAYEGSIRERTDKTGRR